MHCNSASGSAADKLFITGPTLGHRAVIVLSCPVFPVETMHTGGKIKANTSKIGELETDHHTTAQVKKSSWLNALFVVSEQLNVTTLHCTNKVWCCQHKGDFWYMLLKKQSWPPFSAVLQLLQFRHACCNKECFSLAWTAAGMWLHDSLHLEKKYLYSLCFVKKFRKWLFFKRKRNNNS